MAGRLQAFTGAGLIGIALSLSTVAALNNTGIAPQITGNAPPDHAPAHGLRAGQDRGKRPEPTDEESAQSAGPPADAPEVTGSEPGCVQALSEIAQSRPELESHVADGGNSGNENALDHQCGGAFAGGESPATPEAGSGSTSAGHGSPPRPDQAPEVPGGSNGGEQPAAPGQSEAAPGKNKP